MFNKSFDIIGLIKNKSAELEQLQLGHALAEEFLVNVYEFEKTSEYISIEKEGLNVLLPDNDDEKINLFSQLEEIANNTGNKISLEVVNSAVVVKKTKAKVKEDETDEKVSIEPLTKNNMKLKIALTGNQNDLIEFLQKLENMKYFNDVLSLVTSRTESNINMSTTDVEEMKNELLKTTMITVFYLDNK
ncbi:MAG: hypothetical protein ACKUBY_04945 [Candidatus Moraniibacteriota bacterium]